MIKLIRLVLLAAVVLGATVLMALPKDSASEESAQLQSNESNPASAVGASPAPAAGTAGSPSRPSGAQPSGGAPATGSRPSGPAGNGGPAVPTVSPRETGPIQPGTAAGTATPPTQRDVPGTTILPPAPETPAKPARTVWPKTHTVRSGETLQKIAKQYYGGFSKWRWIADANRGVDPSRLRLGQKLKIPAPRR
jgi:nucleoid-associated protein YgaU